MKAGHRIETASLLSAPYIPGPAPEMKAGHRIETSFLQFPHKAPFKGARDEGGSPH